MRHFRLLDLYVGRSGDAKAEDKNATSGTMSASLRVKGGGAHPYATDLHDAADKGDLAKVKQLVEGGADVRAPSDRVRSPPKSHTHTLCLSHSRPVCPSSPDLPRRLPNRRRRLCCSPPPSFFL